MNCQQVRDEIKAYIDGELGLFARRRIESHLEQCDDCLEEMRAMTDLTNDMKNTTTVSAPEGLRAKVMGRLEIEPQTQNRRSWIYRITPASAAVSLVGVVIAGALLFPVFNSAKCIRMEQAASPMSSSQEMDLPAAKSIPLPASVPTRSGDFEVTQRSGKPGKSDPLYFNYIPDPSSPVPAAKTTAPTNLMIIKTADLSVRVADFQGASSRATTVAKSAGGYITDSSEQTDSTGSPTSGTMTVRVPVDSFERTLDRLAALGKVQTRSVNGEDVTAESVDLESRLRNKRAEERQYLEIMNRAKRIPDIVTVTNELSRVRGEIEEIQGRLKYLKSASAMSTINLTLSEKEKPKPKADTGLGKTFRDAAASLAGTLKGLAAVLIWLAVYSPLWAIPLLGVLYMRKKLVSPSP